MKLIIQLHFKTYSNIFKCWEICLSFELMRNKRISINDDDQINVPKMVICSKNKGVMHISQSSKLAFLLEYKSMLLE